jgi:acyl-ACP thioesterase
VARLIAHVRRFTYTTRVGLADAAPDGRARFDAIARILQDAAHADLTDSALSSTGAWVVRRNVVRVERFPRFEEPLAITTWASGVGRMWAERTTVIEGCVESAAIWIHVDPSSGRPLPLTEGFDRLYGPSTEGRKVKARLQHPDPSPDAVGSPWTFRRADLDVADHVNNAAYWTALEEQVPQPPEPVTAEIEFRAPARAGEATVLAGDGIWWVASAEGEVHASLTLSA